MAARKTLAAVARTGQTLPTLESMRDQITLDIEACELRDKAALYLRLLSVLDAIDSLRPAELKGDAVDEITARRAARGAGPAESPVRAKRAR